ncbi:MAG: DUF4080 domain-containing protein [Magnetococcales bacterium]|nr:DUF4080 domain-containing protein [Magnetococcales bacterium]
MSMFDATATRSVPMNPGGILLTTLNARYRHTALGLRCLKANLEELAPDCRIMEFDIHDRPVDIAESLLHHRPAIIGIGVYVWNVEPVAQLLEILKAIAPETLLILGGPEAGYAPDNAAWHAPADLRVAGEGEWIFRDLCRQHRANRRIQPPANKRIVAPPIDLSQAILPYGLYDVQDIKHRFTYVEACRGCPCGCIFCLSANDAPMRQVPIDRFLDAMENLLDRGARQFKFVDRSFNLNSAHALAILDFFLERLSPELFLHFEMLPGHLPRPLKDRLALFPKGTVQLEIGLQTFNATTHRHIQRRQNNNSADKTLSWLRTHTQVHLHTDLILGLPGESLPSMAQGFDRLLRLQPHEIQVGLLKRLHGTALARRDDLKHITFNPCPPYDILENDQIDFATMQRLRRFARYWDLIGNSGRFPHFIDWLRGQKTPFASFLTLSDWLFATTRQTHRIALPRLFRLMAQGLIQSLKLDPDTAHPILQQDWKVCGYGEDPVWEMDGRSGQPD